MESELGRTSPVYGITGRVTIIEAQRLAAVGSRLFIRRQPEKALVVQWCPLQWGLVAHHGANVIDHCTGPDVMAVALAVRRDVEGCF